MAIIMMLILVNGATTTVARYGDRLGRLITPRSGNSIEKIVDSGCYWAADNDAFKAWDVERFWLMIGKICQVDTSRLLWVACPDVVSNAQETINRWVEWYPQINALDLPAAFIGQDGLAAIADQIPWDDMAAFFIGGSDGWKLSAEAEYFAREAKRREKQVHMGRVNSSKRTRHAIEIGCDSIDGRSFSAWPDEKIPKGLQWIKKHKQAPSLF
jgi:hypothetical protein